MVTFFLLCPFPPPTLQVKSSLFSLFFSTHGKEVRLLCMPLADFPPFPPSGRWAAGTPLSPSLLSLPPCEKQNAHIPPFLHSVSGSGRFYVVDLFCCILLFPLFFFLPPPPSRSQGAAKTLKDFPFLMPQLLGLV